MSESNEVPIISHTRVASLEDIQTALKPLKKLKYNFMTTLGLDESFKTMKRPDPTRADRNDL